MAQKEVKQYVIQLMGQLESEKAGLGSPSSTDGQIAVENLASTIFANADSAEREGRADKNVAIAFYTAVLLYDVDLQFGELTPDLVEKRKYAMWKSSAINRCIKEGDFCS
jgi:vacuolar protein sorting-associated protein VTA1